MSTTDTRSDADTRTGSGSPVTGPEPTAAPEVVAAVLADAPECPEDVVALARAVATAAATPVSGDLVTGAGLSDRVAVLARLRTVLDAEVGRSLAAAHRHDVLPHTPAVYLQRCAAWSSAEAATVLAAARLADQHPALARAWRTGTVATPVVAVLARGLRTQPSAVRQQFLDAVVDQLPHLSPAAAKTVLARALDLLHPHDRDAHDHSDWQRRSVVFTRHGTMTLLAADLPGLEGHAVTAALDAVAASLRTAGDGLTPAQRRADALITLVNRAAATDTLPATRGGLPVAATITISASEADRIATGQRRTPATDLHDPTATDPSGLATTTSAHPIPLSDAAARFALCAGTHTPVLTADPGPRPLTRALLASSTQPLAVGRSQRLATPAQRTALALRDRGCIICGLPAPECQTHHLAAWTHGGATDIDNLVLLCWAHHRAVDLNRWTIARHPDPSPDQPPWIVTPTPRHHWRTRPPHPV